MLEGEIHDINLVDRLVELWREQFTGAIRFENDGIIKIIYFKGGDILSASTNDRSDSIDEILMRAGKVSREHVKQALAKRKENETLGDALLNLGFITRKELTWARRVQVVGVIRSIAAWTNGSFTIVADYLPKRDEGTLFAMPQVIVELIVTDQDRTRFERALDGGGVVFSKANDFDDVFRRLGLNEDAEAIATQIDGTKSAAEVASASGRDTFNVYKLLHAFATLGTLTRAAKAQAQPEFSLDDFASAGVADAADMWSSPPEPTLPTPSFELDEEEAVKAPTLEIPSYALRDAEPPAPSAWDEPEEEEPAPAAAPAPPPLPMPAWDTTPRRKTPIALPTPPVVPVPQQKDEQWGFDEAQIETAKRATTPAAASRTATKAPLSAPKQPKKKPSRFGLLIALMVVFILAGGYYGFRWYQNRETIAAPATPAPAPVVKRAPAKPPVTETIAVATVTNPATTETAPAPAPMQVTATIPAPTPTPATTTQPPPQALPPVTPRQGSNRYEAMAREFAANASGNFTVQIQILCEASNLDKAMSAGGANVWFVPQTIGSRSCYRVFWGRYNTREEAQRALANIPASLRDRNSAVKPVPKS